MKVLVTIIWKDDTKSLQVTDLIDAIEMTRSEHPDVKEITYQVHEDQGHDDKKTP
jgi:hypothetical protein